MFGSRLSPYCVPSLKRSLDVRSLGRGLVALSVLVALLSCGDSSTGSPVGPTAASLVGSWELIREPNTSCSGAGTAFQTKYFFTVPPGDAAGSVRNVVSRWEVVQPPRFDWVVSGNFNLAARTVELRFWLRTLETGSMFFGTLASDGSSTGTLVDPIPGYKPHFVLTSCVFTATIRRVGP